MDLKHARTLTSLIALASGLVMVGASAPPNDDRSAAIAAADARGALLEDGDDDVVCTPTGLVKTEVEYVNYKFECDEGEPTVETCANGVQIIRQVKTCVSSIETKTTTTTVKVDSEGNDCSVVEYGEGLVILSRSFEELGDTCPPRPQVCCTVTEHGWLLEDYFPPNLNTSLQSSTVTIPITCPDGSAGTRTIVTSQEFTMKRLKEWVNGVPTGNCPGSVQCNTLTWGDDPEYLLVKQTVTTTDDCP